ncbi:MAG: SDR family NAD(P)-dependent oxidoreductase [Candidatus Cloacimonetes bacterium]|nr:SDR family NAD(P)-dependent oxidoreductase [Candidatus Cloacimonadota bacterium]
MKCIITGGASGLGLALAQTFNSNGYEIIIIDIDKEGLNKAKKYLSCITYQVDLTNDNEISKLLDTISSEHSDLNIFINNAGIGFSDNFHEIKLTHQERTINLNCIALTKLSLGAIEIFRKQNQTLQYIINIGSSICFAPLPLMSVYAASKSYVYNFSEAIREEYKNDINILTVCPSGINTKLQDTAGVSKNGEKLLTPEYVSKKIHKAVIKGKSGVLKIGINSHLFFILNKVLPLKIMTTLMKNAFNKYRR